MANDYPHGGWVVDTIAGTYDSDTVPRAGSIISVEAEGHWVYKAIVLEVEENPEPGLSNHFIVRIAAKKHSLKDQLLPEEMLEVDELFNTDLEPDIPVPETQKKR